MRPGRSLTLLMAGLAILGSIAAPAAGASEPVDTVRAALATSVGSLRVARSLSQSAHGNAIRLKDDVTRLGSRQDKVLSEHHRLVEEIAGYRAKELELAETVSSQRRVAASGIIDMLGRSRRTPTAPVTNQRANLVVAGTVEPWHASEQEQRQAREASARSRSLLGLRASERSLLERSLESLGQRGGSATAEAMSTALETTELVTRVTLMEVGLKRLTRERQALQVADASSLAYRADATPDLLARPIVAKPSLLHEAELLLASLGSTRGQSRPQPPVDNPENRLVVPVDGTVSERFGQIRNGLRHRGLTLVTDHAQPVQAPRGGVIAFAGAFRSFGLVLIINHGHEYHSLVSGLTRLDVKRGDIVAKGQSIGWLDADSAGPGSIYLELRHGGEPIDPWPALAAHEDKVRG